MKKIIFLFGLVLYANIYAQFVLIDNPKWTVAPNSYIFDPNQGNIGLYIPIKKAYVMWASNEYLKTGGANTPIPSGTSTVSVFWEDVPGLIESVALEGTGENAKIKVLVDKKKGEGNAVVSYKVNNQIYWSWHIWVTDDPTVSGSSFSQQFETNINNYPFQVQYLDRNLGATSSHFLGDGWNKSGGLMYQWGRKDPIPTFVYKDFSFFEIYTENGTIRHKDSPSVTGSTKFVDNTARPYDEIGENIRFSVQNPLTILHNTDSGTWFSKNQYRNTTTAWDLWADNYRGDIASNASSSNTSISTDSKSYEFKSPFDPCPNGWRVPSHYGRVTTNNNHSPFGRYNSGGNDDSYSPYNSFSPTSQNAALPNVKVYPGLGFDFRDNSNRDLGIIPVSGNYEYYPNSVSPGSDPHLEFQDEAADGALWEATYAQGGGRAFKYISEATSGTHGSHKIFINEIPQSKEGNAVRCMKDPNVFSSIKYGFTNFPTEFVPETNINYFDNELELPNSYLIVNYSPIAKTVNIPIKKAFSIYAKYFPEDYEANFGSNVLSKLKAAVLWTDNNQLVNQLSFSSFPASRSSNLIVKINPEKYGNAIIALYKGDILNNPQILWSWHVWSTSEDVSSYTYTNDNTLSSAYHIINATPSKKPPLTTKFMDRNLGAVSAMPTSLKDNPNDVALLNKAKESGGLHYQWGRKDPIPSFIKPGGSTYSIYKGITEITPIMGIPLPLAYISVSSSSYLTDYTEKYTSYSMAAGVSLSNKKYINAKKILKYSVEKPLTFLYHNTENSTKVYDWISDENGLAPDRWGHADKKSPFDPCPQGWRVPDVMAVNKEKGTSPWYNGKKTGATQDNPQYIGSNYGGIAILSSGKTYGWVLNDPSYNIGNFPNTSFRGKENSNIMYTGKPYTGVWSSSASQQLKGTSIGMRIKTETDGSRLTSGDQVSPQIAMNVRCVRDEPRYLGETPPSDSYETFISSFSEKNSKKPEVFQADAQESITLYPNPVADILTVRAPEPFNYVIYGVDGKKIMSGFASKSTIDVSGLIQGNYIIDVILKKSSKSLKFIKK